MPETTAVTAPEDRPRPTANDFLVSSPLYELHKIRPSNTPDFEWVQQLYSPRGPLDVFCPSCGAHSVFRNPYNYSSVGSDTFAEDREWSVTLACSRNGNHTIRVHLRIIANHVLKIGQFPAVADLQLGDVAKYRKVLARGPMSELTRAIGLASHGIGVGSFVYLRRIFEGLIDEARAQASASEGWDEGAFQAARMDEKIERVREHLPTFLVQNRRLYSILSKGVHALSEQECLRYFQTVRLGIEMILDEKLQHAERDAKAAAARAAVARLSQELSE